MATIPSCSSPLVTYYDPNKIAKFYTKGRDGTKIDTITIHCYVGQCTAESGCNDFANRMGKYTVVDDETGQERVVDDRASSNYIVGYEGSIGLSVLESDRSWCSSNTANDKRAVTIEVACEPKEPYEVKDTAYNTLILLVADICKRNGIDKLIWSTNKHDRMNHLNGCNMTVHRDFYSEKSCPGQYLYERHGLIAAAVNALLCPVSVKSFNIINSTATDVEAKITLNDEAETDKYIWSYKPRTLTGISLVEIGFSFADTSSKSTTLNIENLMPATPYYLDIYAKSIEANNATKKLIGSKIISTKQDKPSSVTDINVLITPAKELKDKICIIDFKRPESWGVYQNNIKDRYYYVYTMLNGEVVKKLKINENITIAHINFSDLVRAGKLNYGDMLQIGIQTCAKNSDDIELFDGDFPKYSSSIYIEPPMPFIDNIFLNSTYAPMQKCAIHMPNK
jgi:hypothetical protein